ncbi:MAG: aminotransferase class I/II-fold pyridoxal phosphate-dependent enzyme [Myxococcota bacterium]
MTKRTWRSERTQHLRQSEIRAMTRECTRIGGINLGQGICDLPTPSEILHATSDAVLADKSVYSKFEGIDALRGAVARKAREYNRIEAAREDGHVVVTVGATGAWASTVQALFDPGDEIILFEPYYGYHLNTLRVAGCTPKFVTLQPPEWTLTREMLEAARTERTRAVLVCNPTNPSGKVYTREELELVGAFCTEHDLLAVTDEIYEYIVYSGAEHVSMASLPGMWERTVTMGGYSKTFSITGWRLGTIVAPEHLAHPIGLINDLFYVCAPTPLQHGLAAGMVALQDSYYSAMSREYEDKRDAFCATLHEVGLTPHVPDGAYYVLADVSRFGYERSKQAAMHILEAAKVASVPGSAFFDSPVGETLTRFCYAKDWAVLEEAMGNLRTLG